ncbi:troponin I4a isoform X3 [Gadus morhua]|uniref:Troponin I, slow skeletal muscle-like n=1 Tax=Gadus morhua TaxID=8049 RepID=A0A8C5CT96_GADMO|nr:troponin I, slow skeletal muscle-like isoform X3 [Gadus morhua]
METSSLPDEIAQGGEPEMEEIKGTYRDHVGGKKSKYSATRRLLLKGKLLRKAEALLIVEQTTKAAEREAKLKENCPPLKLSGLTVEDLQALLKTMHKQIDVLDEDRYDHEVKVAKNENEIQVLTHKVRELKGTKRPNLKRVKKTGDLVLSGAKLPAKSDFKVALKTVKKDEEKKEEVTDWRKNVEAMSGMDGRKKMFTAAQ